MACAPFVQHPTAPFGSRPDTASIGSPVERGRRSRSPRRVRSTSIPTARCGFPRRAVSDDSMPAPTGSPQGVIRHHGNEVTRVSYEAERGPGCNAILLDSRKRVWAGFSPGGLAVYDSGGVRRFAEADGLAPGAVLGILEDQTGDIWIETTAGISRVQDGRVTTMTP